MIKEKLIRKFLLKIVFDKGFIRKSIANLKLQNLTFCIGIGQNIVKTNTENWQILPIDTSLLEIIHPVCLCSTC